MHKSNADRENAIKATFAVQAIALGGFTAFSLWAHGELVSLNKEHPNRTVTGEIQDRPTAIAKIRGSCVIP